MYKSLRPLENKMEPLCFVFFDSKFLLLPKIVDVTLDYMNYFEDKISKISIKLMTKKSSHINGAKALNIIYLIFNTFKIVKLIFL